jgi:hypothetical protein
MADERAAQRENATYQRKRYEKQQGPMVNAFAQDYGRGTELGFEDYGDIMKRYRDVAGGGGIAGKTGKVNVTPTSYTDPFKSYGGYEEFSKTGGYSPEDMANMRSRGVSPIRAAYANAERNVGRQRALQGGYAPNAIATQAKMAREQGQGMADATQNVEAGLAEARNRGRLSGLGGMEGIEGQRLNAQLQTGQFNADQDLRAQMFNAQADQEDNLNQMRALQGMTSLYGTTPGMANNFGNLLLQGVGQGGQIGLGMLGQQNAAAQLPGQWQDTMSKVNDIGDIYNRASSGIYPWLKNPQQPTGGIQGSPYTPIPKWSNPQQPTGGVKGVGYTPLENYPQRKRQPSPWGTTESYEGRG